MDLELTIKAAVREALREELPRVLAELRPQTSDLLSIGEAAELAGVNAATVREWIRIGKLKRLGTDRIWRVLRSDLLAFLEPKCSRPSTELTDEELEDRVVKMLHGGR
jgi:excisionase family DNA binding protein